MGFLDVVLGRPLASWEEGSQRIGAAAGIPAMGLDGLSSAAYGPEAALTILVPLGAAGLWYMQPIIGVIVLLLIILYFSYRQTIAAYPTGGGSYTVARENLGVFFGLLSAAALIIDYVLNVAVGISAGVAALVSAAPSLHPYTLSLCLAILALITLLNLRGVREAGLAFSAPTYVFLATLFIVLGVGLFRTIVNHGHPHAVVAPPPITKATEAVGLWILLRSFASGCTAMTGVEAVSNGVKAFNKPVIATAQRTLTVIIGCLVILLLGVALLIHAYQIGAMDQEKPGYQSTLSQMTAAVMGRGWFYYVCIGSVLSVLCLSANTSFVDFPRLCRLIARDGYLPRGFALVGRRMVYYVGVLFLAIVAGALLAAFRGVTDRLIPLFAVGAFLAFTLSQAGMVVHWRRTHVAAKEKPPESQERAPAAHPHLSLTINAIGAVCTGVALTIVLAAKFIEGAWLTVIAAPTIVMFFYWTHRHYKKVAQRLVCHRPLDLTNNQPPLAVVPIVSWNNLSSKALQFAMSISQEVIALHVLETDGTIAPETAGSPTAQEPSPPHAQSILPKPDPDEFSVPPAPKPGHELPRQSRREIVLPDKSHPPGDTTHRDAGELNEDGKPSGDDKPMNADELTTAQRIANDLQDAWEQQVMPSAQQANAPIPTLHILPSPYRQRAEVFSRFMDRLRNAHPNRRIAVIIPMLVQTHWWHLLLHNQKARAIRAALLAREDKYLTIVDVPWFLDEMPRRRPKRNRPPRKLRQRKWRRWGRGRAEDSVDEPVAVQSR